MNASVDIGVSIFSFLIGSIPTAFLLVRQHSGKDLRMEGSGNIGALNAFEVSRSKRVGALVLAIDLIKGLAPVLLVHLFIGDDLIAGSLALVCVVAGHNFSPWIGFKGGRGLASAAGAFILYDPYFLVLWGIVWLIVFMVRRNVHVGNIAATVLAPLIGWCFPSIAVRCSAFACANVVYLITATVLLFTLIFIKHVEPLRNLVKPKNPQQ